MSLRRESSEKQEPTADFWKLYVTFIVFFFSKICNFLGSEVYGVR